MAFKQITSPHAHASQNTGKVMQLVLWATLPGLLALTYHFGWGSLINVVLATATAVAAEALIVQMRGRSVSFYLRDYSAAVTAVLLGLALPPLAPWWVELWAHCPLLWWPSISTVVSATTHLTPQWWAMWYC